MRISYSALEAYKRCPLKFKFQYIDKIRAPKSKEAIFGTLVHSALKMLHEPGLLVPSEEELLKFFTNNWDSAIYENEQEASMAFSQGVKMLKDYYAKNYPAKFNVVALETSFAVPVQIGSEVHSITGQIDRVDKTEDGQFQVIDYKTTKKMPSQEEVDKNLQLSVYHLGLANRWPSIIAEKRPVKVTLYFLKHGEALSSVRTPESLEATKEGIIKNLETITGALKETKFPATPNVLCDWCEFQRNCPFFKHKFKEEKLFFNDQDVKAMLKEYKEIEDDIDEKDKKLKAIKADLGKFMDQEGMERLFGEDGYLDRQTVQYFKYDASLLKEILEPLKRWEEVLKVDDTKLKKMLKEIPLADRQKIEEARKLDRETKKMGFKKGKK